MFLQAYLKYSIINVIKRYQKLLSPKRVRFFFLWGVYEQSVDFSFPGRTWILISGMLLIMSEKGFVQWPSHLTYPLRAQVAHRAIMLSFHSSLSLAHTPWLHPSLSFSTFSPCCFWLSKFSFSLCPVII